MRAFPALLSAVQADLRAMLAVDARVVGVRVDGQPPAGAGQWYYAIYQGEIRGDTDNTTHLDQTYGVKVTITRKFGGSPNDRVGDAILLADGELLDRAESLIARVHGREEIVVAANTFGAFIAGRGFDEPLRFRNLGTLDLRGPDWFMAHSTVNEDSLLTGLSITAMFSGARYCEDHRP